MPGTVITTAQLDNMSGTFIAPALMVRDHDGVMVQLTDVKRLPNGYTTEKAARIEARFFAMAFSLTPESEFPGLAEANCWAAIQRHDEQSR